MWKFKASKYKNAAPKVPKKEDWINDLSIGTLLQSCGNHIKASASHMVYNTDSGGGSCLGLLPIDARGRYGQGTPSIQAHSDIVTDFDFSRFEDNLLATCSADCSIKVWRLPNSEDLTNNTVIGNADCTVGKEERRIENVLWHPSASGVLAASMDKVVHIYDVENTKSVYTLHGHGDVVQSFSWKADGSLMVSSCKDKKLRLHDPRASSVVQETGGPQNIKDSRALWLGNKDLVLTTGFDMMRQREVVLRDTRKFTSSIKTLSMDTSTGILMPLFDEDTGMLFLLGKGDTSIRYLEVTDNTPFLTENSVDTIEQARGVALVPKKSLDVMQCEVDRLLVLTKNAIVPLPYHVPRKSYRDFHEDLFPSSFDGNPSMTANEWFSGLSVPVQVHSLDPTVKKGIVRQPVKLDSAMHATTSANVNSPSPAVHVDVQKPANTVIEAASEKPSIPSQKPAFAAKPNIPTKPVSTEKVHADPASETAKQHQDVPASSGTNINPEKPSILREKPISKKVFAGVRQSKFRHLKSQAAHKSKYIDNVRNVSSSVPGESDGFCANKSRCAVPLAGPGGLVTVLEVSKVGKLPDTGIPALQGGSTVMDFQWDPFDDHRIVVASDDAKIRVWRIPEGGLTETLVEPEDVLLGHTEKIYFVRFHPLAKDILASASYDMSVRIWNLETYEEQQQLNGHTDAIFCLGWSQDGKKCATVCKDGKIRIYDPRNSDVPIREGKGPEGSRGARVLWACNDKFLIVTGFDRTSLRQISVYSSENLDSPLHTVQTSTSPAILIPHFDENSSTLFVYSRGESTLYSYEVCEDQPYLFPLSDCNLDGLHQGIAFLPKSECDVKLVEFAKAYRLASGSIEPVSFTVPRVKTEYFQDDLFPDIKVTWKPVMSGSEWLSGVNRVQESISQRPGNMKLLSEAPVEAPKPKKFESYQPETFKTDEMKKEELLSAMTKKLDVSEKPLPQDLTEGVDDDEWDD